MATNDEIQRIARAVNALRPDWPISSLVTFLDRHHGTRAAKDLTIAAVVVALDPKTTTPNLLNQHGPWWVAAQTVAGATASTDRGAVPGPNDPRCDAHPHEHIRNCRACRSEQLEAQGDDRPSLATLTEEQIETNARWARRARAAIAQARGEK